MAYIGKTPATGNFVKLDAISVVNGQAGYTMQSGSANFTPESANHMLVSLNGVIQAPITSFTVSGSTITFASGLSTGDVIDFIMVYGNVLDIGTPSDDTVSTAKLKANAVTTAKITDANITTAKIANDAVDKDKVNLISTSSSAGLEVKGDGTSDGYLQLNCSQNSHGIKLKSPAHSANASYTLTFPTTDGNANQFLQSNGSGVTTWAEAGGGMWQFISSTNITSGVSQVDFTTLSTDYQDFCWTIQYLHPSADDANLYIRVFTGTGGSQAVFTNGEYGNAQIGQSNSTLTTNVTGGQTYMRMSQGVGNENTEHLNSEVILYNPHTTTFFKTIRNSSALLTSTGNRATVDNTCGSFLQPEAVTGIRFYFSSGTIDSGRISMYGRKNT